MRTTVACGAVIVVIAAGALIVPRYVWLRARGIRVSCDGVAVASPVVYRHGDALYFDQPCPGSAPDVPYTVLLRRMTISRR